jgi:predicted ABC-type ATPase
MLTHIHRSVLGRESFAVETTLAGRSYQRMIRHWREMGYHVELIFLHLPSPDLAVRRLWFGL